jgi:aspartyl-tRNA synthetase
VRKFGKDFSFISLRDGKGATQIKLVHENLETSTWLSLLCAVEIFVHSLVQFPLESVISVSGVVQLRPSDQINGLAPTGEVEVFAGHHFFHSFSLLLAFLFVPIMF